MRTVLSVPGSRYPGNLITPSYFYKYQNLLQADTRLTISAPTHFPCCLQRLVCHNTYSATRVSYWCNTSSKTVDSTLNSAASRPCLALPRRKNAEKPVFCSTKNRFSDSFLSRPGMRAAQLCLDFTQSGRAPRQLVTVRQTRNCHWTRHRPVLWCAAGDSTAVQYSSSSDQQPRLGWELSIGQQQVWQCSLLYCTVPHCTVLCCTVGQCSVWCGECYRVLGCRARSGHSRSDSCNSGHQHISRHSHHSTEALHSTAFYGCLDDIVTSI